MWIKLASVPFKNFETLERVVLVDCFTLENLMVGFSNVSPGLKGLRHAETVVVRRVLNFQT